MIGKIGHVKIMLFAIAIALLGSALIICHNIKAVRFNCFNVYDAAIYPQALMEMASTFNFNPYVTLRNVKILNDHFDPILIFMIPWVRLINNNIIGIYLIDLIWGWGTLLLLALASPKNERWSNVAIIWPMFFLSKALIYPLTHPMLTTTWSMFACALLVVSVHKKNFYATIFSSLLLCLFREEYPFAIFTLSIYFLLRKDWKLAAVLMVVSLSFLFFIFNLRPILLGPVEHYGEGALKNLLLTPFSTLGKSLLALDWGVFSIYYPFLVPFFLLFIKGDRKKLSHFKINTILPTLFFLAPLLVIRLVFQKFYFHYSVPIVITLIMLITLSEIPSLLLTRKKILFLTILLFGLSAASNYKKIFKLLVFDSSSQCQIDRQKNIYTEQLLKLIFEIPTNKTILATGGVIPQIVLPNQKLYHLGGMHTNLSSYDFLLLEKDEKSNIWPLQNSNVAKVIKDCTKYISRTYIDNSSYLLIEGPFKIDCIGTL